MSTQAPPLPLNLVYIKTKPAIFKAVSVVSGLIAMILIAVSYNDARYFQDCTEEQRKSYADLKEAEANGEPLGYEVADSCEDELKRRGTIHSCEGFLKIFEVTNLKNQKEYISKLDNLTYEAIDEMPTSCPAPWLVSAPIYMTIVTFLVTVIMLVAMLIVDLNDKIPHFEIVEFIVHLVLAVLSLLSTCFITGFVISTLAGKFSCTQKLYELELGRLIGFGPYNHVKYQTVIFVINNFKAPDPTAFGPYPTITEPIFETCLEEKMFLYKLPLLISGTIFSAVSTVFLIVTAVILIKENKSLRVHITYGPRRIGVSPQVSEVDKSQKKPVISKTNNSSKQADLKQENSSNPKVLPGSQPKQPA